MSLIIKKKSLVVIDFRSALILIFVTYPPVSLSHTGRLLILQEPLQPGISEWTKASRGGFGVKEEKRD